MTNITADPDLSKRDFYLGQFDNEIGQTKIHLNGVSLKCNSTHVFQNNFIVIINDKRDNWLIAMTWLRLKVTVTPAGQPGKVMQTLTVTIPVTNPGYVGLPLVFWLNLITTTGLIVALIILLLRAVCGFMKKNIKYSQILKKF